MKILKTLVLILAILVAIPLLAALFIPTNYGLVEKITIDKPLDEVYDFAKYLENQNQYSKWQTMDPDMEHYYKGEDGTVGFISGWKSENPEVGSGEQEIKAIIEKQRIDYELRFFEPFESKDKAFMTFETLGPNQTEVGWGFEGKMSYPMNIFIPLMNIEAMLADDFRTGLQNLKGILER
jgi:hypothetical protein